MPSLCSPCTLVVFLLACHLGRSDAQTATTTTVSISVNPSSVPSGTRAVWCEVQIDTCQELCTSASINDCSEDTFTYDCTCSDGSTPDVAEYVNTLPYFVCEEYLADCAAGNYSDISPTSGCSDVTCGSLTASAASSTSSTTSASASSSSTTATTSTTPSSSTPSSSSITASTTSGSTTATTSSATATGGGVTSVPGFTTSTSNGIRYAALSVFGMFVLALAAAVIWIRRRRRKRRRTELREKNSEASRESDASQHLAAGVSELEEQNRYELSGGARPAELEEQTRYELPGQS